MATLAVQAYLIASFNFMLAGQNEKERLTQAQIVAILCEMVENEDMHFFQQKHIQSVLSQLGESSLHRR